MHTRVNIDNCCITLAQRLSNIIIYQLATRYSLLKVVPKKKHIREKKSLLQEKNPKHVRNSFSLLRSLKRWKSQLLLGGSHTSLSSAMLHVGRKKKQTYEKWARQEDQYNFIFRPYRQVESMTLVCALNYTSRDTCICISLFS